MRSARPRAVCLSVPVCASRLGASDARARAPQETKNTAWVHEREQLERAKAPDVDEVVMYDDADDVDGANKRLLVSEGLSSNFGVVMRDDAAHIHTARPDTVLVGTGAASPARASQGARNLTLLACRQC